MSGFDVHRLLSLRRVDGVAASPCGSWVAVSAARLDADNAKYVHDLWRLSVDDPDSEPIPLTRGPSDDRAPCFRYDGALGFLSDRNPRDGKPDDGDDDRAQVWILPGEGGEPVPLTDEPLGVEQFRFAEAGDALVVLARVLRDVPHKEQRDAAAATKKHGPSALHYRAMPVRHWDHWHRVARLHAIRYDASGNGRSDLTPASDREYEETEWALSPDGTRLVLSAFRQSPDGVRDQSLHLIDVTSGALSRLGDEPGVRHAAPVLAPDSRALVCSRHERNTDSWGRPLLWIYDLASGRGRAVSPDWDVHPVPQAWSRDGRWILATAEYRGHVPVFRVSVEEHSVERLTKETCGGTHEAVVTLSDGVRCAGLRSRLFHPPEAFCCELEPDTDPVLLSRLAGLEESEASQLGRCETLLAKGSDGVEIHSLLLHPANAPPGPAIVWIHGGPAGAWSDGWHWRWNPLVPLSAGYRMVLPNPRGSTGFGESFVMGTWGNTWGGASFEDVMAVTEEAARRPEIDASSLVAMGGSFGGYMTNWIGANTDRFRCLVTHASLFSLSAFQGVTDHPAFWRYMMRTSPWSEREPFDRYSAERLVSDWKTPTLVIHGERDYRVPISEALALFDALQTHDVPSELLVFPDEGHFVLRPKNIRAWYEAWLDFVARHLGRDP